MRFLFIMDPLSKLDLKWDTSLCLLEELVRRGHETWTADTPDIWTEQANVFVRAKQCTPAYRNSKPRDFKSRDFSLILLRKDPPFDESYLQLTYLLELASLSAPVVNHPRGIRNTNEKTGILHFPKWIPETLVSSSAAEIRAFQKKLRCDLVIKPLNEKGGKGIFILKPNSTNDELMKALRGGKQTVVAQKFLKVNPRTSEKRILILDGKFLGCYEKRPAPGDFRANLGLGGSFHEAKLTARENQMVKDMRTYLVREGLRFVGIDVLNEKLIEINVTSPAGIREVKLLYPKLRLLEAWAESLERVASS